MTQQMTEFRQALSPKGGAIAKRYNAAKVNDALDWAMERDYALQMVEQNKDLRACTPDSVQRCLLDLGTMGLTLSPTMKLAYLIPYRDNRANVAHCTLTVSYLGMEQVAYRTGFVEMIQTALVHENDPEFRVLVDEQGRRRIVHEEARSNRGKVTHAYTIAHFSSGRFHVEVMSRDDIEACKQAAANKNNGEIPWTWKGKFRYEMYKKSCLRRAFKHWPKMDNPALRTMMDAMDRTDPMEFKEAPVIESDRLTQPDIDELVKMMEEAGVAENMFDMWLQAIAKGMGYAKITAVKASRFDEAKSVMQEGIERWKSKQAGSTKPKEES